MTIIGVLGRFTLMFIILTIIVGLILNYVGIESSGGADIGVLIGAMFWSCSSFAKNNGRYFDKSEKIKVVVGFIIIDIAIQAAFAAAALLESGYDINVSMLVFSLGFVGFLHAVAIYFFVGIIKKSLIKQGVIAS